MDKIEIKEKILNVIRITVFATAIAQLAVSQFLIKVTRLASDELTGIFYFAFIITGLVTVFSVSRIKDSIGARFFAVIMNCITAVCAARYVKMLFADELFFRNLYYFTDRDTSELELLPLADRIFSSVPLAFVILGAAIYCLSAVVILALTLAPIGKKKN